MFCINKRLFYSILFFILITSISLLIYKINTTNLSYTTSAKTKKYIIGGRDALRGEFPYMVWLYDKNRFDPISGNLNYIGFCGGVLIRDQWVLTAAHCLTESGYDSGQIGVAINIIDLKNDYNNSQISDKYFFNVSKPFVNKDYIRKIDGVTRLKNDIALIKLDSKVPNNIKPIDFIDFPSKPKFDFEFLDTYVLGWGGTYQGSVIKNDLLQVGALSKVRFQNYEAKFLPHSYLVSLNNENYVKTYFGDSGGPLLYKQSDNVYKLLGIIHGDEGLDGIYEYVYIQNHISWINKTIEQNKK